MSNTRLSDRAQLIRVAAPGACAQSVGCPDVALAGIGTIAARSLAWGASAGDVAAQALEFLALRCAALSAMRRAPHEGQMPRRLQENASSFS
jgi:hypothetical protein